MYPHKTTKMLVFDEYSQTRQHAMLLGFGYDFGVIFKSFEVQNIMQLYPHLVCALFDVNHIAAQTGLKEVGFLFEFKIISNAVNRFAEPIKLERFLL